METELAKTESVQTELLNHVVDASHLRNIGEQSVSNHVQAILELVKNAYDGDAEHCTVTFHGTRFFNHPLKIEKITIEDDGIGMTYEDLKSQWLRVGTSNKRSNTQSHLYGRRVSGEKGMGHYSTQRLGEKLTVVSNPLMFQGRISSKHQDKTLVLDRDWLKYEPGEEFEKIGNVLRTVNREVPDKHGIKLVITELKDEWTYEDIEKVRFNLGNLMIPPELRTGKKEEFTPELKTEGFELQNTKIESNLLKIAPWKVSAQLRGNTASYVISKIGKNYERIDVKRDKIAIGNAACGDADFVLFYYYDRVQKWAKGVLKPRILGDLLKENCGIKIYMDGVRIMPYGERGNDWVELEKRKVRRYGGRVRNETLVGLIKLSHKTNRNIIETTSRQALVENDAFNALKEEFVLGIIEELETCRAEHTAEKKETEKELHPKEIAQNEIEQLSSFMEGWNISKEQKQIATGKLSKVSKMVVKQEDKSEEREDELTSNLELYRNLSTIGLQALAFNHEIMDPIGKSNSKLKSFIKRIDKLTKNQQKKLVNECLEHMRMTLQWAGYIREFATLIAGSEELKKRREPVDLEKTIDKLDTDYHDVFKSLGIVLKKSITGSLSQYYFNRASLESVFINLITNSIKSLKRVDRRRVIKIDVSKTATTLKIRFNDNGRGIKDDNYKRIFRPFFTTYNKTTDKGTGMGLTIVREIIEDDYGGTISLDSSAYEEQEPGNGHATFLITIPLETISKQK